MLLLGSAAFAIPPDTLPWLSLIYKYLYELSEKSQIILVDNTPPRFGVQKKEYVFRRVEDHNEKLKGLIDETKNEIED